MSTLPHGNSPMVMTTADIYYVQDAVISTYSLNPMTTCKPGTIISSSYLTVEKSKAQRNSFVKVPQLIRDPGYQLILPDSGVNNFFFPVKLGLGPSL